MGALSKVQALQCLNGLGARPRRCILGLRVCRKQTQRQLLEPVCTPAIFWDLGRIVQMWACGPEKWKRGKEGKVRDAVEEGLGPVLEKSCLCEKKSSRDGGWVTKTVI